MRRLVIQDASTDSVAPILQKEKLSEEFGRNLDTIAKARLWLTNPHNWHEGFSWIIRWNGLLPTVNSYHGMRMVNEPWDDSLPMVVIRQQYDIRNGKKEIEEEETE